MDDENFKAFEELGSSRLAPLRMLSYSPKDDMTVQEVAKLLPFFACMASADRKSLFAYFDDLPESAKRHFVDSATNPPAEPCT